jgi:hypothetical protein
MAIWVIITASLINQAGKGRDYETRFTEYMNGITKIIDTFKDYKIVIVENQSIRVRQFSFGIHQTFLNSFKVPVLYTRTNEIVTRNYGMKELLDIKHCIDHFGIQDDDFIVKITGRYILKEDSEFVREVRNLSQTNYDAIIRYGSYIEDPPEGKSDNCVTGLIGLRCRYVKKIEIPDEDTYVEWKWAKVINSLEESKVRILRWLGIFIRPEVQKKYFLV